MSIRLVIPAELRCMLCSQEAGVITQTSVMIPVPGNPAIEIRHGLPRCPHCQGNLYGEPPDNNDLINLFEIKLALATLSREMGLDQNQVEGLKSDRDSGD